VSSIIFGTISIILLRSYKYEIFALYTENRSIIGTLESTWNAFLLFLLLIQFQFVAAGALQGIGDQFFGSVATFVGYWLIAVPVGAYLVFGTKLGVEGIWIGSIAASVFLVVVFTAKFLMTDWKKVIEASVKRQEIERIAYLKDMKRSLESSNNRDEDFAEY